MISVPRLLPLASTLLVATLACIAMPSATQAQDLQFEADCVLDYVRSVRRGTPVFALRMGDASGDLSLKAASWSGLYSEVRYDSDRDALRATAGGELGWLMLDLDAELVAEVGGKHARVGFEGRMLLDLLSIQFYGRQVIPYSDPTNSFFEAGLIVDVPTLINQAASLLQLSGT